MTDKTASRSHREWVASALDEYGDWLIHYATGLLHDREAAQDVVQDTFLRLCDQSQERVGDRLRAWLFTVCRNRVTDLLRINGRHSLAEGSMDLPGRELDPVESLEKSDLSQHLLALVEQLPNAQRESIELWMTGLSCREIADVTRRSEGGTRVAIHEAISRIRQNPRTKALIGHHTPSKPLAQK
jgi:RNA polymerase sigma factor (sigma-70 family)